MQVSHLTTGAAPSIDAATVAIYRQDTAQELLALEAEKRGLLKQLEQVEHRKRHAEGRLSILKQMKGNLDRQRRDQRQEKARRLRATEWLKTLKHFATLLFKRT